MRALLLIIPLIAACAGDWTNHQYGPGDWLSENTALDIDTMYNYERLIDPKITVNTVESTADACGSSWVKACAVSTPGECQIYITAYSRPSTVAHEYRHCYGWSHYKPSEHVMLSGTPEAIEREVRRSQGWYPRGEREWNW